MNWYVFFVRTGYEQKVKDWLDMTFKENSLYSLVPKRIVPEKKNGEYQRVEKVLFPGYIFVKTSMNPSIYYSIKRHSKIIRMLNYHNKLDLTSNNTASLRKSAVTLEENDYQGFFFKSIPEEEMSVILKLLDHNERIDFSQVYIEGSRAYVVAGPLKGLEGIIKKIDKHKRRVKVQLHLMGVEKNVELGIELIDCPKT